MENHRPKDMTHLLETCTLSVQLDTFDSEFVLSEFLHEMDELERLQTPKQNESKRQRGPEIEIKPELKRIKPSEQQVSAKPPPRKRRSTSWFRRKQELQALRCESEVLETQVTFLQLQSEHKAAQPVLETPTEDQEMWKSVAAIARGECQNSQNENARLKNELQTCAWAFEKLHTQLIQANSQREKQLSSKASFGNAVRVGIIMSRSLHPGINGVFDMLEGKLKARFFELDVIVRAAYESALEGATEHVRICRKDGRDAAAAVEFKHARLLPFAQDTTADTIWEIIKLGGVVSDKHFRVTRCSNDMVGMSSRFTIPLDRSNSNMVNVDVHAVAKRLAVPIGMVVFIEACSEWSVDHPTSATWKQTTEEEGYLVVNELPNQSDDATPHTCHLQTNMKLRPNGCGGARPTFTGNIGDIVIPSFRDILSSHHQSVENFLLDSSRTIRA
ncbi:hypothetical protein V7S43_003983 [Phytophthora oleae]|uniref:Uncharacterized protein n=1 Tax=Phytophthora oleae TaxID=2107226 RepID=A0ABD3FWM8_9STRA